MKPRRFKVFVWPAALLIIGWLLLQAAYALARGDGAAAQTYGLIQGLGEIVVLIGVLWLAAAVAGFLLGVWRRRNG